jgi:uroporphyrinogen III methyltransferase / synthase
VSGRVYLVGAGPGDPGLLTARALELIALADVVLYDRLIPTGALDGARADAELLYVGKEGGGPSVAQEHTQELMIERALAGRTVVRLKGGDPFVFGRGGEEALALHAADIPFEVVPGVTAGVAASAYAGIPVTHRGLAGAVALVTGHSRQDGERHDGEDPAIDWPALAAFPGTLVLYMGVRRLPEIAAALIAGGRPGSEPVAVVESGTLPSQRTVTGTLETIVEAVRAADVRPPSIVLVGAVATLAEELSWLEPKPLAGLTIAVTRARAQASDLARALEALGARVLQTPVIRVQPIADSAAGPLDPSRYDLICVTSANGVAGLFERLGDAGLDARALAGASIAAIGPATARALAEHGVRADIVSERAVAESLLEALADVPTERALIATAAHTRAVLSDSLRARGVEVDVLALYETIAEPLSPRALQTAQSSDYVTFTSSSTVRHFASASGAGTAGGAGADTPPPQPPAGAAGGRLGLSPRTRVVSIGPITSETLREHGVEPDVEADPYDVEGMIAAVLADVEMRASDGR